MLHVAQTSALLHPAVCAQQPALSSVTLCEDLALKHLREKVTYDQQKVLHVETPTACTVRKAYQTPSTLLLYFTACWARHQLSRLAKMGTSLMSPTQCHNWELFHINLILKGQNLRVQASITERMFTLILLSLSLFFFLLSFFFFNTSSDIFLSYGAVFLLSLYAKWLHLHAQSSWMLIWLVCSYENNTRQTSVFQGEKIDRCPKKACRQKAWIMTDTALKMLWKSGPKCQCLLFCVAVTKCWIAMISVAITSF